MTPNNRKLEGKKRGGVETIEYRDGNGYLKLGGQVLINLGVFYSAKTWVGNSAHSAHPQFTPLGYIVYVVCSLDPKSKCGLYNFINSDLIFFSLKLERNPRVRHWKAPTILSQTEI